MGEGWGVSVEIGNNSSPGENITKIKLSLILKPSAILHSFSMFCLMVAVNCHPCRLEAYGPDPRCDILIKSRFFLECTDLYPTAGAATALYSVYML